MKLSHSQRDELERVRQIVLQDDPRALALWGSGGRTGSAGVMRGRSTMCAIGTYYRANRANRARRLHIGRTVAVV